MAEKIYSCFYCRSSHGWTLSGLKFAMEDGRLCDPHKKLVEGRIEKEPAEIDVFSTPGSFLPPIPKKVFRNYQDREPNDGELIE